VNSTDERAVGSHDRVPSREDPFDLCVFPGFLVAEVRLAAVEGHELLQPVDAGRVCRRQVDEQRADADGERRDGNGECGHRDASDL